MAIDKFGWDKQVDMLIEEMAELTQALLKVRRGKEGALDNLHEEIADVEIVLSQIKIKCNQPLLKAWKDRKLQRLEEKLNNE